MKDATTLECSYSDFANDEMADDFYCTYSITDGTLKEDNDGGLCPTNAPPKA